MKINHNIRENSQANLSNYSYNFGLSEQKDFFKLINYGYWDKDIVDQKHASEKLIDVLLDFIPDKSGKILDVASEGGRNTHYLLKHYHPDNIIGIGTSLSSFETFSGHTKPCSFFIMDAVDMGFKDSSFENIVSVESAFRYTSRHRFFQEALRVLKPGGHLVISDILLATEAEEQRSCQMTRAYINDPGEYGDILQAVGFQNVKVVDATNNCWKGAFWSVVRHVHQKFLAKEIDQEKLQAALDLTYRQVPNTKYYVLAAGKKP